MKTILATLRAKPGQEKLLEQILLRQIEATVAEADTLVYELFRPDDRPDTLIVYERYRHQAAREHHLHTPYLQETFKRVAPLLVEPVTISFGEHVHGIPTKPDRAAAPDAER